MPHSPGVLDFAFVLVNSVLTCLISGDSFLFLGWGGGIQITEEL